MNTVRQIEREAEQAIRAIFDKLGGVSVRIAPEGTVGGGRNDLLLDVESSHAPLRIAVEARSRITPQTAISLCERMRQIPGGVLPVIYAPVISPRVADIARQFGIGYIDAAGNCRLRSAKDHLLIERHGWKPPRRAPRGIANLFSPKSSRIVRALLSRPTGGWKVRELAEHADVDVAVGLVSKVKRTLIEEGYAIEHERLLHLRDPVGLLENWASNYPGPAEQVAMYFRGDAEAAEKAITTWCEENDVGYALAGFSAAWRLAPEVRYIVGAVYIDHPGLDRDLFDRIRFATGGKPVDTGANLLLWRPFDRSVFAGSKQADGPGTSCTSLVQTYLDLRQLTGRGEEAATAVFDRYLAHQLQDAARRVKELRDDEL